MWDATFQSARKVKLAERSSGNKKILMGDGILDDNSG